MTKKPNKFVEDDPEQFWDVRLSEEEIVRQCAILAGIDDENGTTEAGIVERDEET